MIGYLRGKILENDEGKILIGTGDEKSFGVIGYSISVPNSIEYAAFAPGESLELFIYTHVREDIFDLYGFKSKSEKLLFLLLMEVSGIGPKSALNILSYGTPTLLIEAITQKNTNYLTQIPGLGKKTAERMVVELKDTIQKKIDAGLLNTGAQKSNSNLLNSTSSLEKNRLSDTSLFDDAKAALTGLGYRESEALTLLNRALTQLDPSPKKVEDLVRGALRQISQ